MRLIISNNSPVQKEWFAWDLKPIFGYAVTVRCMVLLGHCGSDGRTDRGLIIILYMCMVMEMLTDGMDYGYLEGNTSKLPLGIRILIFSPVAPQNAW